MEYPRDFHRSRRLPPRDADGWPIHFPAPRRDAPGRLIPFPPRRRARGWRQVVLVAAIGGMLGVAGADFAGPAWQFGDGAATSPAVSARFGLCHTSGGVNCVVDGDTFWIAGEKVRVADIDAPETHPPRCAEEARLGEAATARLRELLNAGSVTLTGIGRDEDRYGRKLRVVSRDGRSLGGVLVGEGLARGYGGGRRSWCG